MKKVFLIIFWALILSPLLAQAAGLVPCGGKGEPKCQFCHFFILYDNIVKFLLFPTATNGNVPIVPTIAVLMIAIGGAMFYLSAEDPSMINKAKSLLTAVGIGLVLVYGAWLIVDLFLTALGFSDGWNIINCPT